MDEIESLLKETRILPKPLIGRYEDNLDDDFDAEEGYDDTPKPSIPEDLERIPYNIIEALIAFSFFLSPFLPLLPFFPSSLSSPFSKKKKTFRFICLKSEPGSILIFLPGWDQIREFHDLLLQDRFRLGIQNPK